MEKRSLGVVGVLSARWLTSIKLAAGRNIQVACGVVCNGVVVSVFESILVGERLPALKGLCIIYAASGAYDAPCSHWAWRVIAEHEDGACCAQLRAAIAGLHS